MSSTTWPPALKEWVAKCLSQMTDANREAAQAELKQTIAEAYSKQALWSVDWSSVELTSLKTPPKLQLKRKQVADSSPSKKAKKSALSASNSFSTDSSHLEMRAKRFQLGGNSKGLTSSSSTPAVATQYSYQQSFNNAAGNLATKMNGLYAASSTGYNRNTKRKFMNLAYEEPPEAGDPNVIDWDRYTIVGTSQSLFKNYLRLTSEPDPRDIRPLEVLKQTLTELKKRWKHENNYPWTCDQFKSLRQDLTVQRIKNDFTVSAYEIHARMALESADLVEYNQCQSALRQLYELGLKGNKDEFLAYRILYLLYARNRSDLNRLLSTLTPAQKQNPFVQHALSVQTALTTCNYHALFALFIKAPNMGAYIMDHFVERERVAALAVMTKAYMTLPLSFIEKELAFDSATEVHEFLITQEAAFYVATPSTASSNDNADATKILDCRAAQKPIVEALETKYRRVGMKGSI
ncbi:hypothetical protein BOTBODRAFT_154146 [Botryobasidium botryosum FD-172 SS1]|uniref:PCI domain-containing protein n=1 Tax=Botryobasidium botryosum (strain FD-172 SS1) TaxID=930990 RepID=A0A067N5W6_BOTB1|nr:hypothetical protein BOTBODRAFT_154146 [Botryobasidium botryosum FD-172 SS1]